jgi:hypothetical protein
VVSWLDRGLIDVARERVATVLLVQADGAKLEAARAKATDKNFTLKNAVPKGKKVKSEWDVNNLAGPFERLELEDVRPVADILVTPGTPYGAIATFDGVVVRADIVELEGQAWARLSARYEAPAATPSEDEVKEGKLKSTDEAKKEVETFNAKVGNWAYRLPDWKTENLRKKIADLIEDEKSGS